MDSANSLESSFAGKLVPETESMVLLRRAQDGDGDALNKLLVLNQDRLQRIVRSRLGLRVSGYLESMDIVQDTFQVAIRKIADFELRGSGSVLDWLARIAEHQITDAAAYFNTQKRDKQREVGIEGDPGDSSPGLAAGLKADITLPPVRAERSELRDLLDQALSEFKSDHREVIILRDYCGESWEEIAEKFDRTVGAVQELHVRAQIKLSNKLRPALE